MRTKRGVLLLSLPLAAGLALLAAAVAFRKSEPPPNSAARPKPRASSVSSRADVAEPGHYPVRELPKLAPPDVLVKAADEARIRGTYQNFRTAVAMGSGPAQEALEKTLRRDRDVAVRLAQEDVAKAQDSRDREIALRTLDALRR